MIKISIPCLLGLTFLSTHNLAIVLLQQLSALNQVRNKTESRHQSNHPSQSIFPETTSLFFFSRHGAFVAQGKASGIFYESQNKTKGRHQTNSSKSNRRTNRGVSKVRHCWPKNFRFVSGWHPSPLPTDCVMLVLWLPLMLCVVTTQDAAMARWSDGLMVGRTMWC